VLERVFIARVSDRTYELPAGSLFIPRGMPHGQENLGEGHGQGLTDEYAGRIQTLFRISGFRRTVLFQMA
jgi:hypothetical protein